MTTILVVVDLPVSKATAGREGLALYNSTGTPTTNFQPVDADEPVEEDATFVAVRPQLLNPPVGLSIPAIAWGIRIPAESHGTKIGQLPP